MIKNYLLTGLISFFLTNFTFAQPQLWGTTSSGGSILGGTIFTLDNNGDNYNLIYDWQISSDGKKPFAGLIQANNQKLYGVTFQDGSLFGGVLFEYDYITNTYTKKHDFTDPTGSFPEDGLIQATNGNLYGLTTFGASSNLGTLFEYNLTTNTYSNLADFDGGVLGGGPHGTVLQAPNGHLYGLTAHGGSLGFGTLFEYDITLNSLVTKIDLDSINSGNHPNGSLILASNGKMYGMSNFGGLVDKGLIFEYDYITNTVTKLIDFIGPNGAYPKGDLYQAANGKLYGLTFEGGTTNHGTFFEFDIATGTLTTKVNFDGLALGSNPKGEVMQSSNGKLYGYNNYGGGFNKGVVFEYDIATDVMITKLDFNGVNGQFNAKNSFIEICAVPVISIATTPNDTICEGNTVTLNAIAPTATFLWDNGITNNTVFTPPVGQTTYTVTATNVCGSSSKSINVFANPSYNIASFDSLCSGGDFTFPDGSIQNNLTSSLMQTSSLVSINGCDSIITTNLFVKPTYQLFDTVTICYQNDYTFPDGVVQTNISFTTTHVSNLQTNLQCDSSISTTIELSPSYLIKDSVYVCFGEDYTYPDGTIENNVVAEVIYTSFLQTQFGCDSTIITTLNANPIYNISETVQICEGDTHVYPDGFTITNVVTNTSHVSNVLTLEGCDSIVTTTIIVNPVFLQSENIDLCEGEDYIFPDGHIYFNINADTSHVSVIDAILSCDTLVTTHIHVKQHLSISDLDTICSGMDYTFPDGSTTFNITSTINYQSSLQTSFGCDSIINTNLYVSSVDTSIIALGTTQLISNSVGDNYQWINCQSNTEMAGEVNQVFTPELSGDYAVIISNDYCIDTSYCYTISTFSIGVSESKLLLLNAYPNPTHDFVTITSINSQKIENLSIYNLSGQLINQYSLNKSTTISVDLSNYENGIYLFKISSTESINYLRIIKN